MREREKKNERKPVYGIIQTACRRYKPIHVKNIINEFYAIYTCRFYANYSSIARPWRALLRSGKKIFNSDYRDSNHKSQSSFA